MWPIKCNELDEFVLRSDALGGPGASECEKYWQGFLYQPTVSIDQTLDPFCDSYVNQQFDLYGEIANRDYHASVDEQCNFELERHVGAVNPYDHASPAGLALHLERLSRAVRLAAPPRGGNLLDMGCGWGLSSELAAYTGCRVTAVDINPDFVSLVNRRAERTKLAISASLGTFDEFISHHRFDVVLFYECLHHAVRPWEVVRRMGGLLAPEGKLVLVGEPINQIWWKNWGLRLDALSVYCIRKFGWFESGWSETFLLDLLRRENFTPKVIAHTDPEVGTVIVATHDTIEGVSAPDIARSWPNEGWLFDGRHMIPQGRSKLTIPFPADAVLAELCFQNYRRKPVRLSISTDKTEYSKSLMPGKNSIEIQRKIGLTTIEIEGEIWCPADELANGDERLISAHLDRIVFRYAH